MGTRPHEASGQPGCGTCSLRRACSACPTHSMMRLCRIQEGLPLLSELVWIRGQVLHAQPALPVRHDAPGRIAQMSLRQPVVKHRPRSDPLMGQNRAYPLLIEVGQQRQQIERPPGRVRREIVLRQLRQVRPVIWVEHTPLVGIGARFVPECAVTKYVARTCGRELAGRTPQSLVRLGFTLLRRRTGWSLRMKEVAQQNASSGWPFRARSSAWNLCSSSNVLPNNREPSAALTQGVRLLASPNELPNRSPLALNQAQISR